MSHPVEVFIDCEFNSFKGALITMALVGIDGREWYKAVPLHEPVAGWVEENVVPVLGDVECLEREAFSYSLAEFLSAYPAVHVVADWPEDIQHFTEALIVGPGLRVDTPPLTMEVRRDLDAPSAVPHNALYDARGIRDLYLSLMGDA